MNAGMQSGYSGRIPQVVTLSKMEDIGLVPH